jgi:hypothetical protein
MILYHDLSPLSLSLWKIKENNDAVSTGKSLVYYFFKCAIPIISMVFVAPHIALFTMPPNFIFLIIRIVTGTVSVGGEEGGLNVDILFFSVSM